MKVIKCPDCGEEILQIPEVKTMSAAIQKHLEQHPIQDRERIESGLIMQIFENTADLG